MNCMPSEHTQRQFYLVNKANLVHNFSWYVLILFLYMFWATMCPLSGEVTVSMRHLVFVTLYGWLSGMQGGIPPCIPDSHPYRVYQVTHRCSYFSWWWAHSCLKHVEKRNKYTKKNCAPSWLYLCYYTGMHDRLCGLVVRVSGYRYRGLRFDSRRYQIFWVAVGLERGALSLVRSIEELLE